MTRVPYGFDEELYRIRSGESTFTLQERLKTSHEFIKRYTEDRNICEHILIARAALDREAARIFPSAEGCRDVTREGERL